MRLPLTRERQIDEKRATQQVLDAIDRGVNYLDTAWPYHAGESENFLGRVLAGGCRDKVKIATKLPLWMVKTRRDMDYYLNAQLKKLQTDRIDYCLIHGLAGSTWDRMLSLGVLEFLDAAVADGRIVNPGFSFHGILGDFRRFVDAESCNGAPVTTVVQNDIVVIEDEMTVRYLHIAAGE